MSEAKDQSVVIEAPPAPRRRPAAGPSIESKLHRAWSQERRFYNLRGLSRFLIWLVAMILLDFLIDWLIVGAKRTGSTRFLLLGMNVVVLTWVFWHEWLRYLKQFDPVVVALEVERKHPELASLLVSYTQLDTLASNQRDVSMELVEAMRVQAIVRTRPLDFREVVDFRQIRTLLLVCLAVLLFFTAISVNWSEHMRSLLLRMAGGESKYPTDTQVVMTSGNVTIQKGTKVQVWAQARGVIPDKGQLYIRPERAGDEEEEDWQVVTLGRHPKGVTFTHTLRITSNHVYYIRLGDDQSEQFTITVVGKPRIVSSLVRATYPPHVVETPQAGREDFNGKLDLKVPEGTDLAWTLTCDPPVKGAKVTITDDRQTQTPSPATTKPTTAPVPAGPTTIDAAISPDGREVTFSTPKVDRSFRYAIEWTEKKNEFVYDDNPHSVTVLFDTKPEVELIRPTADGKGTVTKSMDILAQARDDYGLVKAQLVYTINNGKAVRLSSADCLRKVTGRMPRIPFKFALGKVIAGLEDGFSLTYWIEVTDNRPDEPHVSRSEKRNLEILSADRYRDWFREQVQAQIDLVERARDEELKSSSQVKDLKQQESGTDPKKTDPKKTDPKKVNK